MKPFASASPGVHVGLRLRPVDTSFYDLFTRSAEHLVGGAEILAEMLADNADRNAVAERMRQAEHAADETTHEIVKKVNSTFVTPFDREDIYALGSGLDDVMDMMDEAVDLILLYEVRTLPPELSSQVTVLQRCAELTADAMPRLQAMKDMDDYWIEINRLENEGDRNHRRTLAKLFSGEFKTIEVLKLKDIVESLEGAIDAFEKVANIVEQIAVKEG
jgi:predicted phosphate transport protein (TIGR00153 family)